MFAECMLYLGSCGFESYSSRGWERQSDYMCRGFEKRWPLINSQPPLRSVAAQLDHGPGLTPTSNCTTWFVYIEDCICVKWTSDGEWLGVYVWGGGGGVVGATAGTRFGVDSKNVGC